MPNRARKPDGRQAQPDPTDVTDSLRAFGTKNYTYSSENLLLTGPGSTALGYDPAMRLYLSASGGSIVRMAYDGLDRIAEYDGSSALQRRYVHGPGMDEPLVWYEGNGTSDRRFLGSDERGSVISVTDGSGTVLGLNKYNEYGNPQAGNLGPFGYTGQAWLSGINVWYYKARVYDPELGRFLQSDPIGVAGGINLYAYVGNDPVNYSDPNGLCAGGRICEKLRAAAEEALYKALKEAGFDADGATGDALLSFAGMIIADLDRLSSKIMSDLISRAAAQNGQSSEIFMQQNFSATFQAAIKDPDVRAKIVSAWILSKPFGPTSGKNEHGFWIFQKGGNFTPGPMLYGKGNSVIVTPQPKGASILFHVHPFSPSEASNIYFSRDDFRLIRDMSITSSIILSNLGNGSAAFYEYYRGPR